MDDEDKLDKLRVWVAAYGLPVLRGAFAEGYAMIGLTLIFFWHRVEPDSFPASTNARTRYSSRLSVRATESFLGAVLESHLGGVLQQSRLTIKTTSNPSPKRHRGSAPFSNRGDSRILLKETTNP